MALHVCARSSSQTVTLSVKDASLQKVFTAVKEQTTYLIICNKELLKTSKPVSIDVVELPLTNFLQQVMKDQPLQYIIENQTIFIFEEICKHRNNSRGWN